MKLVSSCISLSSERSGRAAGLLDQDGQREGHAADRPAGRVRQHALERSRTSAMVQPPPRVFQRGDVEGVTPEDRLAQARRPARRRRRSMAASAVEHETLGRGRRVPRSGGDPRTTERRMIGSPSASALTTWGSSRVSRKARHGAGDRVAPRRSAATFKGRTPSRRRTRPRSGFGPARSTTTPRRGPGTRAHRALDDARHLARRSRREWRGGTASSP